MKTIRLFVVALTQHHFGRHPQRRPDTRRHGRIHSFSRDAEVREFGLEVGGQ